MRTIRAIPSLLALVFVTSVLLLAQQGTAQIGGKVTELRDEVRAFGTGGGFAADTSGLVGDDHGDAWQNRALFVNSACATRSRSCVFSPGLSSAVSGKETTS